MGEESGEAAQFEVAGNRLVPLSSGGERLEALLRLIDGAEESLRLLYYIYCDDAVGRRVRDRLAAAIARGVTVSLIVDGFGSDGTDADFFAPLREAGADVCRFLPRYGRRYLLRNHQKLVIADGRRALTGGFNVSEDYFDESEHGWRDFGLLIEGPAADHLVSYFDALSTWTRQPRSRLRTLRRALRHWSQTDGATRWLLGGPARRLSPWARAVRADLLGAKACAIIAAYFAPNPGMMRRIERIARTGGQARVMTAALSDNNTTIAAARHCYRRLLDRGVDVFEYQRSRLHTKLLVIDDAVYIGSANFDMRSLFLNMELMLRIEDAGFAGHMRAHFERELADAREITPQMLEQQAGWWDRIRWSIAYFVVAVLDPMVTRRLSLGGGAREI